MPKLLDRFRPGSEPVERPELERLRVVEAELLATTRELDLMGWTVLDHFSGREQELTPQARKAWAKKSRYAYLQDPVAGGVIDLLNEFVFGRGVSKPRASDEEVQEVIDEFWDDPDNQLVLTTYAAQIALGTALACQSNLFVLMFDDGDDGKVKLSLLDHDTVDDAVPDPENRLRVLYYLAKERKIEWDFENDRPKVQYAQVNQKPTYYANWRNDQIERDEDRVLPKPPENRLGKGKVYHIAVNKTSPEQVFGVPKMQRLLRWFTSLNDLIKAQVDKAQAAAAFSMRRTVKGTPNQLVKMAQRAIRPESDIAAAPAEAFSGSQPMPGVTAGSIITENESSRTEPFKIDSGAAGAAQDAEIIRGQISAASGFPQHYLGAGDTANLATATAMELPVLKLVEATQELFEGLFRWGIDRAIERAVEVGKLSKDKPKDKKLKLAAALVEAHEDKAKDEQETERDLGYEFKMPSPLRRVMIDVVSAWSLWVKTIDPNNTNTELSRISTQAVFGEAFEMEDPAGMVERVFPEGYVDPAVQAAQMAAGGGNQFGPESQGAPIPSADQGQMGYGAAMAGNGAPPQGENNPYGAQGFTSIQQAVTRGRDGLPVVWPVVVNEAVFRALPEHMRARLTGHMAEMERLYAEEVGGVVTAELAKLVQTGENGGDGGLDSPTA